MEIKANEKGSRFIEVSEAHLDTIKKYSLFNDLVNSNGYVTDETLERLQNNTRGLLESNSSDEALIDLCLNVLFHQNMKALGLRNLLLAYISYNDQTDLDDPDEISPESLGLTPEELDKELEGLDLDFDLEF